MSNTTGFYKKIITPITITDSLGFRNGKYASYSEVTESDLNAAGWVKRETVEHIINIAKKMTSHLECRTKYQIQVMSRFRRDLSYAIDDFNCGSEIKE